MASAQKLYGFLNSAIIVHAASIRVRFFPIWSFVQDLAEIKMVGCMTSSVYGLCPKVVWILELRHHCSCCINQSAILPLRNTILSRGISSEILMFDPLISKEFIQGVVLGDE